MPVSAHLKAAIPAASARGWKTAMAQPEIESQPPAGNAAFRHGPGRTVLLVAGMLAWAAFFGYRVTRHPETLWFTALVVLCGASMAYTVLAVVIQSVRGIPLLQASEAGIAINDPCGRMLVRWPDAEEFSIATSRGITIRLREGARPIDSMWLIGWWY